MAIVSSIFWVVGFILSVVMGPTLRIWTWGPTMLCFAAATAFAIPNIWRDGLGKINLYILITGLATAAWIAVRACFSPAQELALLDLTLVAMAVSTFIVIQNAFRSRGAEVIIVTGIALLLIANLSIMFAEYRDIHYRFLIPFERRNWPAGFFRHYSHCATFLITSSLLLAGFSMRSTWHIVIKIALFILAIIGLMAVYFTKSRSGFIGAGCGFATLIAYWIFTAKRDDKKWSGLALILAPIVLMGLLALLLPMLTSVQQTRAAGSSLIDMMDNNIRLFLYGITIPCIAMHPFIGGGSRSFSWECYQFWDIESMRILLNDPQHVHNELLQVVTDYGIIGALILLSFVLGVWILCTFKSLVKGNGSSYPNIDAWRIGGIAAFIGIFVQSNFEGTLRIAPGAILLALCLAAASHEQLILSSTPKIQLWFRRITLTTSALLLICIMSFYGFKGSNVALDLWSGVLTKPSASEEEKISAYTRALKKWELESLHSERGILCFDLALEKLQDSKFEFTLKLALEDCRAAMSLHPLTPLHPRNAANILSILNELPEASKYYEKAVQLQGGMEAAFKVHFLYATHLNRFAFSHLQTKKYPDAVKSCELALSHLDQIHPYIRDSAFHELQYTTYINLGLALQYMGEYDKALDIYETLNQLRGHYAANHFIAVLFYSRAKNHLIKERQSDALRLFIEAEKRFNTNPPIPRNSSIKFRTILIDDILKQIQQLKAAEILPAEEILLQ